MSTSFSSFSWSLIAVHDDNASGPLCGSRTRVARPAYDLPSLGVVHGRAVLSPGHDAVLDPGHIHHRPDDEPPPDREDQHDGQRDERPVAAAPGRGGSGPFRLRGSDPTLLAGDASQLVGDAPRYDAESVASSPGRGTSDGDACSVVPDRKSVV